VTPEPPSRRRILGPIGPGRMGEVFLAEDQQLERKVALKLHGLRHGRDQGFLSVVKTTRPAAC
jgi:serine/threonine protein kinase